jgi:endonuclease G, mitochondrial
MTYASFFIVKVTAVKLDEQQRLKAHSCNQIVEEMHRHAAAGIKRALFGNRGPTVIQCAVASITGGCFLAAHQWHDNDRPLASSVSLVTRADAASSSSSSSPWWFQDRGGEGGGMGGAPMIPPTSMTHMLSPTLPIRIIRPNPNLEIAFDVRTKNAIYVIEKLDRQGHNLGKDHKRPNFFEEKSIHHEAYRSKLSHFKNSGFDRGHLAPAADFPLHTLDTYTLCNISPQNHTMNLSIWSQIEEFVRKVADRTRHHHHDDDGCCWDTYVVTGPLWLPLKQVAPSKFQYAHVGLGQPPSLVSVPTHFFKVIAVVATPTTARTHSSSSRRIVEFACFVVPNTEPNKSKGMHDYVVPWTDLEAVTGLQFFPTLATDEWKEWADWITLESVLRLRHRSQESPHPHPTLLLTDGKRSTTPPRKSKASKIAHASLIHLCKGGECRA